MQKRGKDAILLPMKIEIAERLRPFSHTPGAECLIPGTWWSLRAFPTLLLFLHGEKKVELALNITGPLKEFTLQQDLEKEVIQVFGKANEGYFKLRIEAKEEGFFIFAEKTPASGLATSLGLLKTKEHLVIPAALQVVRGHPKERLSLGCHKEQDWDKLRSRMNLQEITPFLFFLAQQLPKTKEKLSFFPEDKKKIESALLAFFQAHTKEMLVPRLFDDQYQGISFPLPNRKLEPCSLLEEAYRWVRSFFLQADGKIVHLLPNLPSSFVCGRLLHIKEEMGTFDFEWSNGSLKKVVFRSSLSGEIFLKVAKSSYSFRIRTDRLEKGLCQKTTEPFKVQTGTTYLLDRFQHA